MGTKIQLFFYLSYKNAARKNFFIIGLRPRKLRIQIIEECFAISIGDADDFVADIDAVVAVDASDFLKGHDIGAVDAHEQ